MHSIYIFICKNYLSPLADVRIFCQVTCEAFEQTDSGNYPLLPVTKINAGYHITKLKGQNYSYLHCHLHVPLDVSANPLVLHCQKTRHFTDWQRRLTINKEGILNFEFPPLRYLWPRLNCFWNPWLNRKSIKRVCIFHSFHAHRK